MSLRDQIENELAYRTGEIKPSGVKAILFALLDEVEKLKAVAAHGPVTIFLKKIQERLDVDNRHIANLQRAVTELTGDADLYAVDTRDYFAAAALTGLLAHRGVVSPSHPTGEVMYLVDDAYNIADAMFAARDGKPAFQPNQGAAFIMPSPDKPAFQPQKFTANYSQPHKFDYWKMSGLRHTEYRVCKCGFSEDDRIHLKENQHNGESTDTGIAGYHPKSITIEFADESDSVEAKEVEQTHGYDREETPIEETYDLDGANETPIEETYGGTDPNKVEKYIADTVAELIKPLVIEAMEGYASAKEQFSREQTTLIGSKINSVMAEIHAVAKTEHFKPTEQHAEGFYFRKIDELIAELNPILVRHRLFYHPAEIKSFDQTDRIVTTQSGVRFAQIYTRLRVRWKITCALDGSFIDDIESVGEGVSEQQFSSNAALTMAEKAMLCDIFCIPVYGDRDPEAENPARAMSANAIAPAETAPSTDVEAHDARQPALFQEPASTEGADGKRTAGRKREPKEPQIAAAAGAVLPETAAATNPGPMTPGLLQIIRTNLKSAKKEEKDLCEHFKVEKLESLGKDKMAEVTAWIQG